MDNLSVHELKKLIESQSEELLKKNEMIKSLWSALNKAYSRFDVDSDEYAPEEDKRYLIRDEKIDSDAITSLNTTYPSLDDSIFTNNLVEKHNSCMLCLFPINDSLHGSQTPKTYTLECGHIFHLLCLYETVQRRECRKVCGECWVDIESADQDNILDMGKHEKRNVYRESKDIANRISKYKK